MRPSPAKDLRWLSFLPLLALASTAEPITKDQLLELVQERVDAKVIGAFVRKDCVDFVMDAQTTIALSKV